jgi:hypothetical protein
MIRTHGSIVVAMLLLHCGGAREPASAAPPPVSAEPPAVTPLVAEAFVGDSCARQRSGRVWCWDRLAGAQLPVGTTVRAPALDGAVQIEQGALFDYVVLLDGRVRRSGRSADDEPTFLRVPPVRSLARGVGRILGLLADGRTLWWEEEQLYDEFHLPSGAVSSAPESTRLPLGAAMSTDIWTCVVASTADRRVFCIGYGPHGEMILPRFRGRSDYAAAAVTCARNSNSTGLM